jgi:hypothetical protein
LAIGYICIAFAISLYQNPFGELSAFAWTGSIKGTALLLFWWFIVPAFLKRDLTKPGRKPQQEYRQVHLAINFAPSRPSFSLPVTSAVFNDPATAGVAREVKEVLPAAARALGLTVRSWEVRNTDDFEKVFAALTKERPDGLYVHGRAR